MNSDKMVGYIWLSLGIVNLTRCPEEISIQMFVAFLLLVGGAYFLSKEQSE